MEDVEKVDEAKIKARIVDHYGFVKDPNRNEWTSQPTFEGHLGKDRFKQDAELAKQFFLDNNEQESPWENLVKTKTPINLLYITAARYLLVTYILWEKSGETLIPCKEKREKYGKKNIESFEIPPSVCFPKPYGSATYKSDYDVGLIGKKSGELTKKFNEYFQSAEEGFGKPSELVFDTNVYAFTLEYAMPRHFLKLPDGFTEKVEKLEQKSGYRMLELAGAYYKVFKYNAAFFDVLTQSALTVMITSGQSAAKDKLKTWLDDIGVMNRGVPLKRGADQTLQAFREAHNTKYQTLVNSISTGGGYKPVLKGMLSP